MENRLFCIIISRLLIKISPLIPNLPKPPRKALNSTIQTLKFTLTISIFSQFYIRWKYTLILLVDKKQLT